MSSFIYFVKPIGADGPIKIGCSRAPEGRLAQFLAWSPSPLEIIATTAGDFSLEQNLHECFADAHLHHEWFRATPGLLRLIDALRAGSLLSDAVDLTKRVRSIRKKGVHYWPPDRRRYMSYVHRLRHAFNRLRLFPPDDVNRIMARWGGSWPSPGITPSEVEVARLDEVIAGPATHGVPLTDRYPRAPAESEAASS